MNRSFAVVVQLLRLTVALLISLSMLGIALPAFAQSTQVGTLSGKFSVTPAGAPTYSMPLDLPPGIGGVQPRLAITYLGGGADSFLGAGFGLSGLSQITRCARTVADNGAAAAVTGLGDDFCLDGQRLVSAGTQAFRTQIESFQRITANGSSVNPTTFTVQTQSGLTMTYGGTAAIYDYYNAAVTTTRNTTYVWLLSRVQDTAGNYMTFSYSVPNPGYGYYIDSIQYTGNDAAGIAPPVNVRFTYQARSSLVAQNGTALVPSGWVAGARYTWSQLLTQVSVSVGGQAPLRTWNITYQATQQGNWPYSRLTVKNVQLCGAGASCLPPTQFDYAPPGVVQTATSGKSWRAPSDSSYKLFTGDFNNNGFGDLIAMKATTAGSGYLSIAVDPNGPSPSGQSLSWTLPQATSNWFPLIGDFNGDGYTDAAFIVDDGACGAQMTYALGNGAALGSPMTFRLTSPEGACTSGGGAGGGGTGDGGDNPPDVCPKCMPKFAPPPLPLSPSVPETGGLQTGGLQTSLPSQSWKTTDVLAGDFNGDGLQDLLLVSNTANGYNVLQVLSTGTGFAENQYYAPAAQYSPQPSWRSVTGDLNADGKTDLVLVSAPGSSAAPVAFTCLDAQSCQRQGALTGATLYGNYFSPFIADLNGDGSQDLLLVAVTRYTSANTSADAYAFFSNGFGGFAALSAPRNAFAFLTKDPYTLSLGDFDGDGFIDLGFVNTGNTSISMLVSANNGAGVFFGFAGVAQPAAAPGAAVLAAAADVNGTGHSELLALVTGSTSWLGIAEYAGQGAQRVSRITDGYGATVSIGYAPLTDALAYDASRDSDASAFTYSHAPSDYSLWSFPNRPFHAPLYVVSSVTSSGGGTSKTVSRRYAGARVDLQGRGFLGFAEVIESDSATGLAETTHIRQDFPYAGKVAHKSVSAAGALSGESTVTYALQSTGTPSWFPVASRIVDRRFEIAVASNPVVTSTVTDNTYDSYGELTGSTARVYAGDVGSATVFTTQTANFYGADNAGSWLLGRLDAATVTRTNPDGSSLQRRTTFSYDGATGLLSSEIVEPQDPTHWLETDYQRDALGNVIRTTVKGPDIVTRASTESFPTAAPNFGRFSTSSCNALNQCTTRAFDASGALLSSTDANGVSTLYAYDALGRATGSSINQAGAGGLSIATTITRQACNSSGNLCNGLGTAAFYVKTASSDGRASVDVFDSAERLVRRARLNGDGSWVEVLTQYDAAGRPVRVSSPRFANAAGANTFWTQTAYDAIGRAQSVTAPKDQNSPSGSVTAYSYNGLTTSATNPRGYSSTKTLDALGRLAQSVDANGSAVSYRYDPEGNLVQTTDSANHATTLAYDVRGHKTRMTDPDMGTWTYVPDVLGQVVRQTDAKGNVMAMQYDVLGRMTQRTEPEDSTVWTYDTAWKGALYRVTVSSGGTETYRRTLGSPTPFGAMQADVTVIDGNSYTTSFAYDSQGRQVQVTYPASFATATRYNAFGAPDLVYQPGNSANFYWRADAWDEWGKVYLETYGNTVQTISSRDVAVGRIATVIAGPGGSSTVQSALYGWDAGGNLTSRQDQTQSGPAETFQYDALDRLVRATQNVGGATSTLDVTYDALGNITSKSGIGAYSYATARPHAVSAAAGNTYQYDANGSVVQVTGAQNRVYTWASYNLPTALAVPAGASVQFEYGPSRERVRQTVLNGSFPGTIDFVGGLFEAWMQGSSVTYKNYVVAPTGTVAVVSQVLGQPQQLTYLHHDALGSVAVLTDAAGNVTQRVAFDAFGQRRVIGAGSFQTPWGYTGHLSLDDFNLVHMNGRVYDSGLGRFISADPFVQAPGNLQSLNRYSYVWNNPLTLVDGNGYWNNDFAWSTFIQCAAIYISMYCPPAGAALVLAAGTFAATYITTHGDLTASFVGAGFSLLGSWAGESAGSVMASDFYYGYALTIIYHGMISYMQAGFYGQSMGRAFAAGAVTAAAEPLTRDLHTPLSVDNIDVGKALVKGTVGGTASELGGGNFANGAITMAFLSLMGDFSRYTANETDQAKIRACTSPGANACIYDERGVLRTDGTRDTDWSRNPEMRTNAFTRSGMADEGSGEHVYDPGRALDNRLIRYFITDVSKIHDWFNSWNYDPASGRYVSGGVRFDTAFQGYSFVGMPIAAVATVLGALGNMPMSQVMFYQNRSVH